MRGSDDGPRRYSHLTMSPFAAASSADAGSPYAVQHASRPVCDDLVAPEPRSGPASHGLRIFHPPL